MTLVPLATSLARAGRLDEAQAVVDRIMRDGVDPIYEAMAQSSLGDEDATLAALERGIEKRSDWMYSIATQPWFREYHDNPRFIRLLKQMNLLT